MSITTEIVTMKLAQNIQKDDFIRIVDALEQDFHAKQDGFIDTELLFDEKHDEWIMVQHWTSAEQLTLASKNMFQDEMAASFVKSLDPKSVKMRVLPQLKTWG